MHSWEFLMINFVMIDLDDTLIPNAYTYWIPKLDALKIMAVELMWKAPSPAIIMQRALEFQLADIKSKGCISKTCFAESYMQVYKDICAEIGTTPRDAVSSAIFVSCSKYFLEKYSLFGNVKETLTAIKQPKICVTRGDYDIQMYKITNTKLDHYFDSIEIVDLKTEDTYANLIKKYDLKPEETVMIGDSLMNDIKPAMAAGLSGIHVTSYSEQIGEWENSHVEDNLTLLKLEPRYTQIKTFAEVLKYLD